MQNAVTLQDVAKAAKVSKTTASNVFSRPEGGGGVREGVGGGAGCLVMTGPTPRVAC